MTKYDFKIRRGVFRSGNLRSKRDFQGFESKYRLRKRAQTRMRNLIIMIAVVFLIIMMLFSIRAISATDGQYRHELEMQNVNQTL